MPMYKTLSCGAIGVRAATLHEAIAAAKKSGFAGVEFSADEAADLITARGVEYVRDLFRSANVRPAAFGLPVDWRSSEDSWRQSLIPLPRQAGAAQALGCARTMTWILPGHNELPYEANRQFHIDRFTPIARVLADHGISLGLEFIGPKTLRDTLKHPFIHTMSDMLAMGAEIGPNVGLLLDAWHWYTSHGTVEELRALRPEQVAYVHVNDAPVGIDIDSQLDQVRCLPGETGVIDIGGFLRALDAIGYDGPITAEPFKKELAELPSDDARLETVSASLDAIFRTAGLIG